MESICLRCGRDAWRNRSWGAGNLEAKGSLEHNKLKKVIVALVDGNDYWTLKSKFFPFAERQNVHSYGYSFLRPPESFYYLPKGNVLVTGKFEKLEFIKEGYIKELVHNDGVINLVQAVALLLRICGFNLLGTSFVKSVQLDSVLEMLVVFIVT